MTLRKIWHLAWNDVRIEFSSRWTLVFFLVLPVLFTAIIGVGFEAMYGEDDEDARFPVLVVDEDGSPLSTRLVQALEASAVIRPVLRPLAEAQALMADDNMPGLLRIPAGFGASLSTGEAVEVTLSVPGNDNRAVAVQQAVNAAAQEVSNTVAVALASVAEAEAVAPLTEAARRAYLAQGLDLAATRLAEPPARVETIQNGNTVADAPLGGFEQSSAGQLVTWTLITLIGAAEVFVSERVGGTLSRLVITPTQKATILTGKIVGRLGMGLVQMIVLIGLGAAVFGVGWGRSPLALALVVLAFALAAVAFGVMLGTFIKTRNQAGAMTTLFAMLMAALGGAWWPLEVTPPAYQTAVKVLPTTWAMAGFSDVVARGQGVAEVLPEVAVLLGFALVFITIGVWRFRYE